MPGKGYVVGDSSAWLRVKSEGSGAVVALPSQLQVDIGETRSGREHFVVLEGVNAGKRFDSVPGHLKVDNPGQRAAAQLRFELGAGVLHHPGGRARAKTQPENPIPIGSHPIQIPDFVHACGQPCLGRSAYATTWMYLGRGHAAHGQNDRYRHCGLVSHPPHARQLTPRQGAQGQVLPRAGGLHPAASRAACGGAITLL